MTDINTYYLLLRRLRIERGITQTQLAKAIGVPQSYVSKYENGEQRLDLPELKLICDCLNVDILDFIKAIT